MHMLQTAVTLIKTLQNKGYIAYIAGGAVRDMLLGKVPKDVDIATNALPETIEAFFDHTYAVGKQFGVIHVHAEGHVFEVATFRSDSGYSDGRRPDYVTFATPEEDARRRDFTINALFYDPITEQVMDYVGGQKDLEERVIRFVGNPDERILEDRLRLLRAVRFAHQIEGQYEPETYWAIKRQATRIQGLSMERVRDELNKMLLFPRRAEVFEDLQDLGLLHEILPEIELLKGIAQPHQYHREGSVWNHAMRSLSTVKKYTSQDLPLLWAVLLHDVGKPQTYHMDERIRFDGHAEKSAKIAQTILTRLRQPKYLVQDVCWAIEHHMSLYFLKDPATSLAIKRKWFLDPRFPLLLEVHRADALGTIPKSSELYSALRLEMFRIKRTAPKTFPKLLTGSEVMSLLGITGGPDIGQYLERIRHAQLNGDIHTKQEAKALVQKIAQTLPLS